MATTSSIHQGTAPATEAFLRRVRRRHRVVDAAYALSAWAWLPALAAAGWLAVVRLAPLPLEFASGDVPPRALEALVASLLFAAGVVAIAAWQLVRRRPLGAVAQRVDLELALADRLATAWWLHDGPAPSSTLAQDLAVRQQRDAAAVAAGLASAAIPVRRSRRGTRALAALAALGLLLAVLPNPQHAGLAQRRAVAEAAKRSAEEVEKSRRDLVAEEDFSEEDRARLDAALAKLRDELARSQGRADDTLAEIAAAEAKVRRLRDPGAVRRGQAAQAMAARLATLAKRSRPAGAETGAESNPGEKGAPVPEATGGPPADASESATPGSEAKEAALGDLADLLGSMTDQERAALAEALASMSAEATANMPEVGAALRDLASAAAGNDAAAAGAAADALGAALSGEMAAASAAAAVEGTLATLQTARSAVAMAQGQGGQDGTLAAFAPGAARGQGLVRAPGQGAGRGAGQGAGSRQGAGQGAGAGQGQGSGRSPGGGSGPGGGFGRSGSGDGSGQVTGPSGDGGYELTGAPQEASPGDQGLVFAPAEERAPGRTEFVPGQLGSGAPGRPLRRRQTRKPGLARAALVPYERVYAHYAAAAGAVLEREQIPGRWREYVRRYFEQLEPQ